MRWLLTTLVLLAVLGGAGVGVYELHRRATEAKAAETPAEKPATPAVDHEVHLDAAAQSRAGIATEPLTGIEQHGDVRAFGRVLDPLDLALERQAWVAAQAQVAKAAAAREIAVKERARLETLRGAEGAVSEKAWDAAVAQAQGGEIEERAARDALLALEGAIRAKWGAELGAWLAAGSDAMQRLLRHEEVLVQVSLPTMQSIASLPHDASVVAPDGTAAKAALLAAAPRTDPRFLGRSFLYVAPAEQGRLQAGMNVVALLPVGEARAGVLVPERAVVWWQGRPWVYVQRDAAHFVRRAVPRDDPLESGWFVAKGIAAGERIVTEGAQVLLSEELRAQIKEEG